MDAISYRQRLGEASLRATATTNDSWTRRVSWPEGTCAADTPNGATGLFSLHSRFAPRTTVQELFDEEIAPTPRLEVHAVADRIPVRRARAAQKAALSRAVDRGVVIAAGLTAYYVARLRPIPISRSGRAPLSLC